MKGIFASISSLTGALLLVFLLAGTSTAQPAQAQAEITDQDKAVHYSLYYEDFKNQNFESALPNLKWILANAPFYPRNVNFERLIEAYTGLSAKSEDPTIKRAYLDSALAVFDDVLPVMKEHGVEFDETAWTIDKGRYIQTHGEILQDRLPDVAAIYLQAFEAASCEIDPYYVRVIIDNYMRADEKDKAVDMTDQAEACYPDTADMMSYITEVRNALFRTPEERMTFLETRLEKNPDDVEIASELFDIYLNLGEREKAATLGSRLATMKKSARVYRMLGQLHLQDGEAQQALEYYEQALELPDAGDVKRDIYFNMGIAQQQLGRLSAARSNFRQSLEVDSKFGQAYLAIGDLYVTAVGNCGSFEREDRAVYWLAVDYYERARSVDPSVANQANQKIGTYRRSFPDQEALFFKNWKAGQSYRIDYGCYGWIGETTTIRTP
ncbi:MAG: tetratricopeptide repeat protein [Rhodothermales bacterium]